MGTKVFSVWPTDKHIVASFPGLPLPPVFDHLQYQNWWGGGEGLLTH